MDTTWYHGSPLHLAVLRVGSTITADRDLARVFSHKPAIVSIDDDGTIVHTGTVPGLLYRVAEEVGPEDVYPHPRSSMGPGKEWLTRRELRVELIGPTQVVEGERLTECEVAELQQLAAERQRAEGRRMRIERAGIEDAGAILDLQKLAYGSEAAIYGQHAVPPLTQSLEGMVVDLRERVVLKAVLDDRIVGSVRARMEQGTCSIGRLIVHPDVQNQGIGTRLMGEIEALHDQAGRFELFTGHRSERNLYLYRKLGYKEFKRERITDALTLVFLEKRAPGER
jgi:ribosomal protein S18 acetylase RimI-like enzyme